MAILCTSTIWGMQNWNPLSPTFGQDVLNHVDTVLKSAGIDRENNTFYLTPGKTWVVRGTMISVHDNGVDIHNKFHPWEGLTKIGIKNNKIYVYDRSNGGPIELCDLPIKNNAKTSNTPQVIINNSNDGKIHINQNLHLGKKVKKETKDTSNVHIHNSGTGNVYNAPKSTFNITNAGTGTINIHESVGDVYQEYTSLGAVQNIQSGGTSSGWSIGSSLYSVWNTLKSIKIGFSSTITNKQGKQTTTELNLNPLPAIQHLYKKTTSLFAQAYVLQKSLWPCWWMKHWFPWSKKPSNMITNIKEDQDHEQKEDETQEAAPTFAPPVTMIYPAPTAPSEDQIDVKSYAAAINNSPLPVNNASNSVYPFAVYNTSPYPQDYTLGTPIEIPQTPANNPFVPTDSYYQSTGTVNRIGQQTEQETITQSKKKKWIIDTLISCSSGNCYVTCDPNKQEGPFLQKPDSNILTQNAYTDLILNLPGLRNIIVKDYGNIYIENIGTESLEEAKNNAINISVESHGHGHGDITLNRKTTKKMYSNNLAITLKGYGYCNAKNLSALQVNTYLHSHGDIHVSPISILNGCTKSYGRVKCYTPQSNLETDFEGNIEFI